MTTPIVTLLTDFGTADYFVAAMKGVILTRDPRIPLVDITHEIPPQDVPAAAFTLLAAYRTFPPGTVHLAVVDPGVGSERRPIAADAGGHRFVGPDNGLFSYVFDEQAEARVVRIEESRFFRSPVSTTFHGRDVFAPIAAALATRVPLAELGPQIEDAVRLESIRAERTPAGAVRGTILHLDRFGNCVTSLRRDDLAGIISRGAIRLEVNGREIRAIRDHYAEAPGTEPFAIWGSAGFLEIAVNRTSAAAILEVVRGDRVTVTPA